MTTNEMYLREVGIKTEKSKNLQNPYQIRERKKIVKSNYNITSIDNLIKISHQKNQIVYDRFGL